MNSKTSPTRVGFRWASFGFNALTENNRGLNPSQKSFLSF